MFNTDIIHFLQQLDHPIVYWFMVVVSLLGTIPVILTIVLGISFGVDLKKGLVLTSVIAWTALSTNLLKEQIDFPRPPDVDPTIHTDYYKATDSDLRHMLPTSNVEVFSGELLNITRNDQWNRYGLPSGHSSIQVALWLSLFFLFRKRWIRNTGIAVVVLTILSRLYLGHHFLGDVIVGSLLGFIMSGLLLLLVRKTEYLTQLSPHFKSLSILWLPLLLVPFTNHISIWILASMLGLNGAAILVILYKNFPIFHVILWKRILACLISSLLIFLVVYIDKSIDFSKNNFLELLIVSIFHFVIVLGSLAASNKLNLIRFRF